MAVEGHRAARVPPVVVQHFTLAKNAARRTDQGRAEVPDEPPLWRSSRAPGCAIGGGLVQMQLMMVRATGMQGACTVLAPLPLPAWQLLGPRLPHVVLLPLPVQPRMPASHENGQPCSLHTALSVLS